MVLFNLIQYFIFDAVGLWMNDVLGFILHAAPDPMNGCGVTPYAPPYGMPPPSADYECTNCAGSAFHAVTAAFATLGYYAQSSWLIQIFDHGMQKFAIIAYILAALFGIYGFVMGANPRRYIWLFMGPPLCWWLIGNMTGVTGVQWLVGNQPRNMEEVWALAEPGLLNEDSIIRFQMEVTNKRPPEPTAAVDDCHAEGACVADFFAYFDMFVSELVQQLVALIGVNRALPSNALFSEDTNIIPGDYGFDIGDGIQDMKWDLVSNMRWEFFAAIGDARIKDANLRRAFATFLASDCGPEFMQSIDKRKMTASAKRGTPFVVDPVLQVNTFIPGEQFQYQPGDTACLELDANATGTGTPFEGYALWSNLKSVIPTPRDVLELVDRNPKNAMGWESNLAWMADNTDNQIFNNNTGTSGPPFPIDSMITCRAYLTVLMQGFRWEAAHTAFQIMTSGPKYIDPKNFLLMMFYGWDINLNYSVGAYESQQIDDSYIVYFLENLVLAHIFRNELEMAPGQFIEKRYFTTGEQTIKNVEDFQRINNSRAKFGELYTWALMVPYFQGKLLYFLAIAYPFAAMFVVVPGMQKIFIQWMQFWIWVKLWDLGFAVVMVLERSVWAMTNNTLRNSDLSKVVMQIAAVNDTNICVEPYHPAWAEAQGVFPQYVPEVNVPIFWTDPLDPAGGQPPQEMMMCMLDRLLALSNNTDLDLANTHYIYIMSALYLAVPAITGQLVLGAKSGAASMVSSAIGGIAQPAGSAAGNAATAEWGRRVKTAAAIGSQQAYASELSKGGASGFAGRVLGAQNQGAMEQGLGTYYSGRSQGMQGLSGMASSLYTPYYTQNARFANAHGAAFSGYSFMRGAEPYKQKDEGQYNKFAGRSKSATGSLGDDPAKALNPDEAKTKADRSSAGGNFGSAIANLVGGEMLYNSVSGLAKLGAKANAAATDFGLKGSAAQMQGQLANMSAQRGEAHAGFGAEESAWRFRDNYAEKMSDMMGAVTGSAEALNPGQKPTNMMGMAMSGMLNRGSSSGGKSTNSWGGLSNISAMANASNPGGSIASNFQSLSDDFMYARGANGQFLTDSGGNRVTRGAANLGMFDAAYPNHKQFLLNAPGVNAGGVNNSEASKFAVVDNLARPAVPLKNTTK